MWDVIASCHTDKNCYIESLSLSQILLSKSKQTVQIIKETSQAS